MATMRLMVWALLLTVVLAPAVGMAFDDLAVAGTHHSLRPPPTRGWRTPPAAVDRPTLALTTGEFIRLDARDAAPALPPLTRALFVPPRG